MYLQNRAPCRARFLYIKPQAREDFCGRRREFETDKKPQLGGKIMG